MYVVLDRLFCVGGIVADGWGGWEGVREIVAEGFIKRKLNLHLCIPALGEGNADSHEYPVL